MMKKKRALAAVIFLFVGLSTYAQVKPSVASTENDELILKLQTAGSAAEVSETLAAHKPLITSSAWARVVAEGRRSYEKSEYDQSELLMRAAKQIAEELNDAARVAASLGFLGEVYLFKGEPSKAIEILLQSEGMLRGLRTQQYSISVFKDLALAYRDKGDFQTALSYAEQTRKLAEEINDREGTAWADFLFGNINYLQTKYDEALKALEKSGHLLTTEVKNETLRADVLSHIAAIYLYRGNKKETYRLLEECLSIAQRLDQPKRISRFLKDIGGLYYFQGDFATAFRYYNQSLQLAEKFKERRLASNTLYNMGFIANEQGQHEEALAYLQRALRLKQELEDRDGTLTVEEELAATYMSLGRYDLAQENLDRSLTNADEQTAYHRSVSLYYLGKLYLLKGDYERAISYLHHAAQIGIEQQRLDLIDPPLVKECRAYYLQKQYEKARQTLAQQIKQTEWRRELIVGGEVEKALFFETSIEPYQLMVDVLLAQNKQFDALTYADQARGRVLRDVLLGGRADILRSLTPTEIQTEERLNAELVSLNIKLSKENAQSNPLPARLANLDSQLEQARLAYEALTMSLYAKYQKSRSTHLIDNPLTADDLRVLVSDTNSAVLEYDVTEDRTWLFVLTKDDTGRVVLQTYPINLGKRAIEQMVQRFRLLVTSRDQEYAEPAQQLYQALIGPAEQQLASKTSIGIVPNAALWALPFQALQSPKNGRFMIEDHSLYYTPSLTVMRELINKRKASGNKSMLAGTLLAVGDPLRRLEEVSLERDDKLGKLPHAQEEIGSIINSYGARRSTSLTGRVAGERAIKVAAPSQRVLHFAAHTVLDNYRPMYSRILLAAPTVEDAEDGQLEAREIMNMHLEAELVVLSSCQTALGRVGEGEGVIGMAWAFGVAGVPTTVATQWGVESESTATLMTEFYQRLLPRSESDHRQTKAEALQAAQLVLLNTKKYRHPFYWAPFVMIGDGPSPNF